MRGLGCLCELCESVRSAARSQEISRKEIAVLGIAVFVAVSSQASERVSMHQLGGVITGCFGNCAFGCVSDVAANSRRDLREAVPRRLSSCFGGPAPDPSNEGGFCVGVGGVANNDAGYHMVGFAVFGHFIGAAFSNADHPLDLAANHAPFRVPAVGVSTCFIDNVVHFPIELIRLVALGQFVFGLLVFGEVGLVFVCGHLARLVGQFL